MSRDGPAPTGWRLLPPPSDVPPPVPLTDNPYLAGHRHPAMPRNVSFARDSVLRLTPDGGRTPEAAGRLARSVIDELLPDHPAILLRGLPIGERSDFAALTAAMGVPIHDYMGGNAARDRSDDRVSITSIDPAAITISPHNENCYMPDPPDIILFCCLERAARGGEVPINDIRKTLPLLPPDFVAEMRRRRLRYIRRLPKDGDGYCIGWRQSFATDDRSDVDRYLESKNCTYEWSADESLMFWFNTDVFRTYRGQELWFNQLSESNAEYWLHHPIYIERGTKRGETQSDTAYGDTGEPFSEDITGTVRAAIWKTTELIALDPGDVIVLDNNLIQHGRMPYEGTRRHLVSVMNWPRGG